MAAWASLEVIGHRYPMPFQTLTISSGFISFLCSAPPIRFLNPDFSRSLNMQCNIDAQGARIRLTWGIMALLGGLVFVGLALWSETWWLWLIAIVCVLAGAFAIFESRKKWCALRAMGFKTPV